MSSYKQLVVDNERLVEKLSHASALRKGLVQNIVRFVKCLVKPGSITIDKQIFWVVMSHYFDIVDQNIINKINMRNTWDTSDGSMSVETFAMIICIFLTDNTDLKIDYVFGVYDANHDGLIDMIELVETIRNCRCVTDVDEADKDETFVDLMNMVTETLGIGTGGLIKLEEFRRKAKHNVLFLSILGQSLPSQDVIERFKQLLSGKNNLQMKDYFKTVRQDLLFEIPCSKKETYYQVMLDLP